jgi:hypothetical protein
MHGVFWNLNHFGHAIINILEIQVSIINVLPISNFPFPALKILHPNLFTSITFLSLLWRLPSSTGASRVTPQSYFLP